MNNTKERKNKIFAHDKNNQTINTLFPSPTLSMSRQLLLDCSNSEPRWEQLCSLNNGWEKTGVRSGNIHVHDTEDTVIWFTSCIQPQHCVSLSMCNERSNVLTHFFCALLTFPLAMQTATNSELPNHQKEKEGGDGGGRGVGGVERKAMKKWQRREYVGRNKEERYTQGCESTIF